MMIEALDRVSLALLPTPVHEMPRLASTLGGPRLFIKRKDQTGLAFGGNKTRKLEFLMADALRQGADTVITVGAAQSNHCRQTAAAAAACGLDCELVLNGEPPEVPEGNLVLDRLFRARIHWTEREKRDATMEELAERLRAAGKRPYLIPCGGSNAVGAAGYAAAMGGLMDMIRRKVYTAGETVLFWHTGGTPALFAYVEDLGLASP